MKEFSKRKLLGITAYFFLLGFFSACLFISYQLRPLFGETVNFTDEEFLDNIRFIPMTHESIQNLTGQDKVIGVAIGRYESNYTKVREIGIVNGLPKYEFIRTCNHEILHHLLDIPNASAEEEYVSALDNCVRFPVCYELLNLIEKKK